MNLPKLSPADLRKIAGAPGKADVLNRAADTLPETCERYGIETIPELAMFLGQIVVEGDHFRTTVEYADGWDYDISRNPRKARELGNLKKGDGPRYKGFGEIQTTGAANQREVADALGILAEWEKNPRVLADFPYAMFSAGHYWQTRKCSSIARRDTGPGPKRRALVEAITEKVNGRAKRALVERVKATERAFDVLEALAASQGISGQLHAIDAPGPAAGRPAGEIHAMVGDDGPAVTAAQSRLVELGYHLGKKDGRFGPATRAAVLAFQADNGIETTGLLDDETLKALFVAEPRPIVEERANATVETLRADGSRTVASADRVGLGAQVLGGLGALTGAGKVADASGALDTAKSAVDQVSAVRDLYDSVSDVAGWALAHWWLGAIALAAFLWFERRKILGARLEDLRNASNLGR